MKTPYREKPAWLAAGLRVFFLVILVLLLLPALAPKQSARPSGGPFTARPDESELRRGNLAPPGLRSAAPGRENPGYRGRAPIDRHPAAGFQQNLAVLPAVSIWRPSQCPLPPASVFALQTNLRRYLETWPTPGSTATEAWPEYVAEDGEGVD